MSTTATSWAHNLRGPRNTQRLVMFVLADHASGEDHEAWPGIDLIARKVNASKDTVKDALNALIAAGYVEREINVAPRRRGVKRGNLRNLYRLPVGATEAEDDGQWRVNSAPQPDDGWGAESPGNGGVISPGMGGEMPPISDDTPITRTKDEPSVEPASSSTPPSLPLTTDLTLTTPAPTPGQRAASIRARYWDWATATYGRAPDVNPIGFQQILARFLGQGVDEARLRAAVRAIHEDGAPMTRAVIGAELDGRRRRGKGRGPSQVETAAAALVFDERGNLVG